MIAYQRFDELTHTRLESICDEKSADKAFEEIATQLFNHFFLQKGEVCFRFLEIEFYYHSGKHPDLRDDGSLFVYERDCHTPGAFLIHPSGVDLCFRSQISIDNMGNKQMVCGGGILLRCLLRIDNGRETIVAGPWDCCDALFNYSTPDNYPELRYAEKSFQIRLEKTARYHAPAISKNKRYCFYDAAIEEKWQLNRFDTRLLSEKKNTYPAKPFRRI